MSNSTEMIDLVKTLGLDDLDSEDFGDSGGFANMSQIENPTSAIRSIKTGFGDKQLCLLPFWMQLPFNISNGERYPRGKSISTIRLGISPDKAGRIICDLAKDDPVYREKVCKILNPRNPASVVLEYEEKNNDIAFNPATFRAFAPFMNPFAHTEPIQKYTTGPSSTIARKALIPMNEYGLPNFEAAPSQLLMSYKAESLLMNQLVSKTQAEMEAAGATKKKIEDAIKDIRKARIISSPRMLTVMVAFVLQSNGGGEIVKEVLDKVGAPDYNVGYNLEYFSAYTDTVSAINTAKNSSDYPHLSYIPVIRTVPEKSDQVTNPGQAASKTTYGAIGNRTELKPEVQIPDIAEKINTVLETPGVLTIERLKGSVMKFQPMNLTDAMACFRNCAPLYSSVLSDKAFIESNRKLLSNASEDLGLSSIVSPIHDLAADSVSITASFKSIPDVEDEDAILDSEDLESGLGDVAPSDFVKNNA